MIYNIIYLYESLNGFQAEWWEEGSPGARVFEDNQREWGAVGSSGEQCT